MRMIIAIVLFSLASSAWSGEHVTARLRKLACNTFMHQLDDTEKCRIDLMVRIQPKTDWNRLACFGELKYVSHAGDAPHDATQKFIEIIRQSRGVPWPGYFKLQTQVTFRPEAKARHPEMDWYTCSIIKQ